MPDCRVINEEDLDVQGERKVLEVLKRRLSCPNCTILCHPTLAKGNSITPDLVVLSGLAGVQVIEVKGVTLDQIERIEAGGTFHIRYDGRLERKTPVQQSKNYMFDIKDPAQRNFPDDLQIPFGHWVVFTGIERAAYHGKFGEIAFCPDVILFKDDLPTLVDRITAFGRKRLNTFGIHEWPNDQLQCVLRHSFGGDDVINPTDNRRPSRKSNEGTLGAFFDRLADDHKHLSEEQKKLSEQDWRGGPRLIRGVAGSGKTIVLANNLARSLERFLKDESLFRASEGKPRILTVCFNRKLKAFIEEKIRIAYGNRNGEQPIPEGCVEVNHYEGVITKLVRRRLLQLRPMSQQDGDDEDEDDKRAAQRAELHVDDLSKAQQRDPDEFESHGYDAIYVDEAQDIVSEQFKVLAKLCRTRNEAGEPNLYIFYDDFQNLYGRRRPVWKDIGITLVGGRSHVMEQCFRNTRQIIEPAFNVLYGRYAKTEDKDGVPRPDFADLSDMKDRGLIEDDGQRWRVNFAKRDGNPPQLHFATNQAQENKLVVDRLRWFIEEQDVRPQDILVLSFRKARVEELVASVKRANLKLVEDVHIAFEDRDDHLVKPNRLSFSTVHSAKGYDSFVVLLVSVNDFPASDLHGRVLFYVGCTRAMEHLEILAYRNSGLATEMQQAVEGR